MQDKVVVLRGVEGLSVYINNYRVAGPKPWGGGTVVQEWAVKRSDIEFAIKPKQPSEMAWAAGLFEGEGCITFASQATGRRAARPSLQMLTTDEDVLRRFARIVAVGKVYGPYPRKARRPVWRWGTANLLAVQRVLSAFAPYLGDRRRARAEEVLALALSTGHRHAA